MAYWPFTFRQLVLLGIVALSSSTFVYQLSHGGGFYIAVFQALITFGLLSGLLFGSLALWDLLKAIVKGKRPAESKEPAESTKGRRYRRLR